MTQDDDEFISKTQRKRQMLDLQGIGVALTKLSVEQIERMELPELLHDAIIEAKRFTKHEALRRQLQYIGRIMRDLDVVPIAEKLAALHAPSKRDTALFHRAEEWRTKIMKDAEEIKAFVAEFPDANAALLSAKAEAANKERDADKPPKHFRELFHEINTIMQDQARKSR